MWIAPTVNAWSGWIATRRLLTSRGGDDRHDWRREKVFADPRLLEEMLRRTAYTLQPDGW